MGDSSIVEDLLVMFDVSVLLTFLGGSSSREWSRRSANI